MKKLLVLCLSLFVIPLALLASPPTSDISSVVEERHQLFILGVLSYLYNRLDIHPKPGWDIAALIAWDVEKIDQTPEFVIDRNQNFEKQGNIFHAEIMTIEKAALKKKSLNIDSSQTLEELHKQNGLKLTNATLYSSLEPCLFCTMGITWSRIPKVVYFMQDPTTRNRDTYDPLLLSLPNEFCGRTLTQANPSSLPFASKTNQELKDLLSHDPPGKYVTTLPNGQKVIDFSSYFKEKQKDLLRSGHELFCSYEVIYDQNKELFNNLAAAIETLSQ